MLYPPIYHVRCTVCDTHCLAVAWDLRCLCVTCERVAWQVCEAWQRDRTPWVDVLDQPIRLFQIYTPAEFLAWLGHLSNRQDAFAPPGVRLVVPGLRPVITRLHRSGCQWDNGYGHCDGECPEEVTYEKVAAATN